MCTYEHESRTETVRSETPFSRGKHNVYVVFAIPSVVQNENNCRTTARLDKIVENIPPCLSSSGKHEKMRNNRMKAETGSVDSNNGQTRITDITVYELNDDDAEVDRPMFYYYLTRTVYNIIRR